MFDIRSIAESRASARTAKSPVRLRLFSRDLLWRGACDLECVLREERRFVYVLRSVSNPNRHYVGTTSDVHDRLRWHNEGPSGFTVRHRPWALAVALEFTAEREAVAFERYLKSGSGRAFAKRHFAFQPPDLFRSNTSRR
jgi:putative endonuclease